MARKKPTPLAAVVDYLRNKTAVPRKKATKKSDQPKLSEVKRDEGAA